MSAFVDIGILTNHDGIRRRCEAACAEFEFTCLSWKDIDSFQATEKKPKLVIAFMKDGDTVIMPAETAQLVSFTAPDAFVICVAPGAIKKEEAEFARKSGANLLLTDEEVLESGKLEFVCLQTLNARYLPVKPSDLVAGQEIPFDLYHLMPMRQKYVVAVAQGTVLKPEKLEKARAVGELYLERGSAVAFKDYVKATADRSETGIQKICRSQFLALQAQSMALMFQLSSQTENASVGEGQALMQKCQGLCGELLAVLANQGKPWEIINNSVIGQFGSVERAPAVAAYAGLFGHMLELPELEQLMTMALLADLGMLFLSPTILHKIREDRDHSLTDEELKAYHRYPLKSVQVALDRKLSLSEKLRHLIQSTQELWDGTGFPEKLSGSKVPIGAQLIGFARRFDRATLLRMGKGKVDPKEALKSMLGPGSPVRGKFAGDWMDRLYAKYFGN